MKPRQLRCVEALVAGKKHAETAAAAGISERQLSRWRADPVFHEALVAAGRQRLATAIRELRAAAVEAVQTLREALADDHTANRIRAAHVLLSSALETELSDLADRVAALEAAAQIGGHP